MTDLRNRFQGLDDLRAPDLWREIQGRAAAVHQPKVRPLPWALIVVILLLALALGGAALIGSGLIKLPAPSSTATWTTTGAMADARDHHTATLLLDGTVLVVGGDSQIGYPVLGSAERYNPRTGSWTATAASLGVRTHHTATLLRDGRVLVAGGQSRNTVEAEAIGQLYDPTTETWIPTGELQQPRTDPTATLLRDGTVLVVGGYAGMGKTGELVSAEVYDPSTLTWATTGQMTVARAGHTATLLRDGRVLVTGGYGGTGEAGELASAEIYDPTTGTWLTTDSMAHARAGHTATLLPDGRVLVVGGIGIGGGPAFTELFDPKTGSWSSAGETTSGDRYAHTATLLANGRVLVAGGFGPDPLAGAELWDPSTGTWTATAGLIGGRAYQSATSLAGGKVLVAGGVGGGQSGLLGSAELYDPGSGS